MSNWACSGAINEQGSAQARAMIEAMNRRADFLASQYESSPEYDHNDQDGSFLNDDYCDRLDNENHD